MMERNLVLLITTIIVVVFASHLGFASEERTKGAVDMERPDKIQKTKEFVNSEEKPETNGQSNKADVEAVSTGMQTDSKSNQNMGKPATLRVEPDKGITPRGIIISSIVTAVATVILAGITLFHLIELRKQRDLVHEQIVLTNAPSVICKPFIYDPNRPKVSAYGNNCDAVAINWYAENLGGAVDNLTCTTIVLRISIDVNNIPKIDDKVAVHTVSSNSLKRNERYEVRASFTDPDTREWILNCLSSSGRTEYSILFAQAAFEIPAALTLERRAKMEQSFIIQTYVHYEYRYVPLPSEFYDLVTNYIREKQLL